jgi:hypothetical protein
MGRYRLTIVVMMGIVVAFAMAFAALRSGSDLWFSAFYTLTAFILLVAIIAARLRRGPERSFWFGFAVFGLGFYFLGLGPVLDPIGTLVTRNNLTDSNRHLLTTRFLYYLVSRIRSDSDTNDLGGIDTITRNTLGIAFLILTLVMAIGGGLLALVVRGRKRPLSPKADRAAPKPSAPVAIILVAFVTIPVLTALSDPGRPAVPYFPVAEVESKDALESSTASWYSEQLYAMGEPSLWALAERGRESTVYRFLLLPSFLHPICVRIEKEETIARLHATVLDGHGGDHPGRPVIQREVILDAKQWSEFVRRLDLLDYWGEPKGMPGISGSDGDSYIIEGVQDGKYRILKEWEPQGPYLELCDFMLKLADIRK